MSRLFTINNRICTASNIALYLGEQYNPLDLPPFTVRVRTNNGQPPIKNEAYYTSATLVPGTSDVYDVYKNSIYFTDMLKGCTNVIEVLGANTANVVSMSNMFYYCTNLTTLALFDTSMVTDLECMFYQCTRLTTVPLFDTSSAIDTNRMFAECVFLTSVPLFDTSNVTNMERMFYSCSSLTTIPLFNTFKVTNMDSAFMNCTRVESGALALYQQASTQTTPPNFHSYTFYRCGINTVTGAAELEQIPNGWR